MNGTNVVGILKSQNFNTAMDEFIILGAHLDTRGLQNVGVNKDGSGLTALITLAEDLNGESYHELLIKINIYIFLFLFAIHCKPIFAHSLKKL